MAFRLRGILGLEPLCVRDYISRHLFRALNSEVEKHRRMRDEQLWKNPLEETSAEVDTCQQRDLFV